MITFAVDLRIGKRDTCSLHEEATMKLLSIEPSNVDWFVIEDNQGNQHRYVKNCEAAIGTQPHIEAYPNGWVGFSQVNGKPVLEGDKLPDKIILMKPEGEITQTTS